MSVLSLRGLKIYKGFLDHTAQTNMLEDIRAIAKAAPLFSPITPYGKPMSVKMTSAGDYGWYSDQTGYRYRQTHPNGNPWPAIPSSITDVWKTVAPSHQPPESCLINYYDQNARMGMHQDKDEANMAHPVVSISLGDEGLLRIGNTTKGGSTQTLWLQSGDVVVMGAEARLIYHGIERIRFQSSRLLPKGGRINITLRVVT